MLIVQPYVPRYRVAFFSTLIDKLGDIGISCRVAAATPRGHQLDRDDAVDAEWIVPFSPRQVNLAGRTIGLGGARKLWANDHAVIVGHLGSSIDTYLAILDAKRNHIKVGLWGHIKSYVNDGNPIDLALEKWQLRQSDHVFAYSPGGRDYAVNAGVSREHITTVMNATDTSRLAAARRTLAESDVRAFMNAHGLRFGKTLGYIGGLDVSKRIGFLSDALDQLWSSDPEVRILVGGKGSESDLLSRAVRRGQVVMMGYVDAEDQAMIARVSAALLMPGRIGLVAVDALVLGVPVLTTKWKYHAPESEFLHEGESRFSSDDDLDSYVAMVRRFLETTAALDTPPENSWLYPTIDSMVENFRLGVVKMLESSTHDKSK